MTELQISEAESRVMEVIWAAAREGADGAGVEQILAGPGAAHGWGESTVRTLIHRLLRKGALRSQRRGLGVVYVPRVSRQTWVTSVSQGLLDRLFGGQLAPMVAHFASAGTLSPSELSRLREVLADLEASEGGSVSAGIVSVSEIQGDRPLQSAAAGHPTPKDDGPPRKETPA